jgi:predicted acylesterase/phospholipase RssA
MVLVGAYQVFAERGHTFGRLLGTSAGAITAALLAAGYTAQEMLAALTERENGQPVFAGFMGVPPPFDSPTLQAGALRKLLSDIDFTFVPNFIENRLKNQLVEVLAKHLRTRHFVALVERGGWFSAHRFLTWLAAKLDTGQYKGQRRAFSKMTLAEFFAATQTDLALVAADATGRRLLVLNHRTAPQCPLVYAVRMSMSIPLLWDEVVWQAGWGAYQGRDITGHAIVDGGLLSNFPIELFLSDRPHVTALMGPKQSTAVLGLLIDDLLPVPQPRGLLVEVNVKPMELQTVQRITNLIETATTAHDKMVIEAFAHLVVRLPAGGYGVTEFDMSDERREALVDAGRLAMRAYLERNPTPAAVPRGEADAALDQADAIATRLLAP